MATTDSLLDSLTNTINASYDKALFDIVSSDLPSLIDGALFKGIPLLSGSISLFHIGKTVREMSHIRKIARFMLGIIEGKGQKKLDKYIERMKTDEDFSEREIEYLIIVLDRYFEDEKASLLSKLFVAFLETKIDWQTFKYFASALDTLFLEDIEMLRFITFSSTENGDHRVATIARLQSIGFAIERLQQPKTEVSQGHALSITRPSFRDYMVTHYGRLFYSIIHEQ